MYDVYAHESSLNLQDPVFFAGFLITSLSWLATTAIGLVHVVQFCRKRARETRLKVSFLLVVILPMVFIWTWTMMFFGSLILDCPWETAILVYEPIAMYAFLDALYRLAGGETTFVQKLSEEPAQNFFFSCIPHNILDSISICTSGYLVVPFSKRHLRYAKHSTLVASAIKYAYAALLWLFFRTDLVPFWAVQLFKSVNTVATMVSFHGLLVVVQASDSFLVGHDIHHKFWTLKGTVLLVLVQGFILNLMARLGWLPVEPFWGDIHADEYPEFREGTSYFLQGMLIAFEMPFAQAMTLKYWRPVEIGMQSADIAHVENPASQDGSSNEEQKSGADDMPEVVIMDKVHESGPAAGEGHIMPYARTTDEASGISPQRDSSHH